MATMNPTVRLGIDVGGTNTDAVALDYNARNEPSRGVLAKFKAPTTSPITSGIATAVQTILTEAALQPEQVSSVTIGTTHFINAVIEHDSRRLRKVAVLRISKSFLREVPPFSEFEFPPRLARILNGYLGYVDGGLHIDGSEECPIVESQVVKKCCEIRDLGIKAIVIAGVFSPIGRDQEERVREIVLQQIPDADVVASYEIANIGFLERENASIINAAILHYARQTVAGFKHAMRSLRITCPLFLTQNDGTLIGLDKAAKTPIRTFASGATNSMRGAAYLSGHSGTTAAVVDIGGTTSDVGVLLPSGLPRQASAFVTVAGVRVNYSMPHLHSVGLGGGSIVRHVDGQTTVGPLSVGYKLGTEALVFGGNTMTASDIAVAAGRAEMGHRAAVRDIPPEIVHQAQVSMKRILEKAIDAVKTTPDPIPVLLVGGGAILAPASIDGASEIQRPVHFDVANAVGAAISKVGGSVDIIQSTVGMTETEALEKAKALAIERAIVAGAVPKSVLVAEVESIPVAYMPNQLRTTAKAIGELDVEGQINLGHENGTLESFNGVHDDDEEGEKDLDIPEKTVQDRIADPITYMPKIVRNHLTGVYEWHISETDIDYLAIGCYILGCAGGGSTTASRIQLRSLLRDGYGMRVVDPKELQDGSQIYYGGIFGSPVPSVERLQGLETVYAYQALMSYLKEGESSFEAVMPVEIGGANGMEAFLVGSSRFFNKPVVDGDWMGRAFPTCWQTSIAVYCPGQLVPVAADSGDGKTLVMTRTTDDETVDSTLRSMAAGMGSKIGTAFRPGSAEQVQKYAIPQTVSLAWRIGRCVARGHASNRISTITESIIQECGGLESAKILFRGKIVAVERRLLKAHSYGEVSIASIPSDEDEHSTSMPAERMQALATGGILRIPFKNESIYAEHTDDHGRVTVLCSVPDLIAIVDAGSGQALGTPEFKYGYTVDVIGITASPLWTRTERAVQIGGPKAFGFDLEYKPVGVYAPPRSVIEEYKTL